jgi:hypothetical protein
VAAAVAIVVLRSLDQYYCLLTFLSLVLSLSMILVLSQSLQPPMIFLKYVHSLNVAVGVANLQSVSPEVSVLGHLYPSVIVRPGTRLSPMFLDSTV